MKTLLESDEIKPNPIRLVEGASFLERSQNAINLMREGRVSGEKLVVRVTEAIE
jgi:hypothetical protein